MDDCEFHVGMILFLRGDVSTHPGEVCRTCSAYAPGIWVDGLYDDLERVGDEGLYFKRRDLAVSMNARGAGFGGDKLCPHVVGSADVGKRACGRAPGLGEMEKKRVCGWTVGGLIGGAVEER